jgi:hypothetical protein
MTSEPHGKPTAVRIELTDDQKQRVASALGDGRLAAGNLALELTAEELERRVLPGINLGN